MAYTMEQANALLADTHTEVELRSLVSQLDITTTGNVTVLYGGKVGDNIDAGMIIKSMIDNDEDIRVLDKTEASKFLDIRQNAALADALERIFGSRPSTIGSTANQFLYGSTDTKGTRIPNGAWDNISGRFVAATEGEIRTLTPDANSQRVFAQTELTTILEDANTKVTHINGIPREDLVRLKSDLLATGSITQANIDTANKILLDHVNNVSAQQISEMKIVVDADGKFTGVGTKDYFNKIGLPDMGTDLSSGVTGRSPAEWIVAKQTSEAWRNADLANDQLTQYGQERLSLAEAAGDAGKIADAAHYLNKLGIIGDVLGLALVASDANAAYAAGDTAGAQQILSNWALEFAGGLAGGLVAAELVSSVLAPLYLAGPAGAILAGGLTLLAGIAGSLGGGYLAKQLLDEFITNLQNLFHTAELQTSPIILDLDGDGVETLGAGAGIHFDHDGNGFAETSGWVGKDDGLLVWDKNANDQIDSGAELFGNNTVLGNGSKAVNGFAALVDLDSNHDGRLDAQDSAFGKLRLWQDRNSDGQVQDGELLALDIADVQSLSTSYSTSTVVDADGNLHKQVGSFTRADGSSAGMTDVWFKVDTARTVAQDLLEVTAGIAALPDLAGFGNVHGLHQAMARDASGHLQALVEQFSTSTDPTARHALMTTIIYTWTGVETVATDSRGTMIDARKLTALEMFLGESFRQYSSANPATIAAQFLEQAFHKLSQTLYSNLLMQTHLGPLFEQIGLVWNDATDTLQLRLSALATALGDLYATDRDNTLDLTIEMSRWLKSEGNANAEGFNLAEFEQALQTLSPLLENAYLKGQSELIEGSDSYNTLRGGDSAEWIRGGAGNDSLYGGNADDMLDGEADNDILYGEAGNDSLDAGTGNDTLNGGNGSDSYILRQGSGYDVISQSDSSAGRIDAVHFENVLPADIRSVQRVVNDLILSYGATDMLTVRNHFSSAGYRIDEIRFANGTVWGQTQINDRTLTTGTSGTDSITGYNGSANRMSGLSGNDYLYGGDAADLIDGGADNDSLSGRAGNDTLLGGDGNDTLNGEGDNDSLDGGTGLDILNGGDGNDSLDAGTGNDTLNGGNGSDSYILRQGSGYDVISQSDSSAGRIDAVHFENVLPADIRSVQRVVNDLILSYGATDMLTVRNHFSSAGYRIDEIRFANGTVWGQTQINDRTLTTGTSGTDSITGYNGSANRMSGLSGNDYLYGGDAADLIDGGADNDSLSGRAGNDTLLGGDGNDTLNGEGDNDSLDGGTGLDILNGGDGNDSLDAGTGNDTLNGGNGSDSYILRQGSGYDVISQSDSSAGRIDAVHFENVLPADIRSVQRVVNDLILSYGATDMLTVRNHFSSAGYRIDEIRFANGTVWGQTQINDRTLTTGTSGTDSITGYNGSANRMSGLSGNDYLYGGDAADLIDGGADNDSLSGRAGNDTLLGGDGNDTLNGEGDNDSLDGGTGLDILNGGDGNDSLDAGTGNDTLNGGNGSDSYILRQGSGYDVISQSDSSAGRIDAVHFENVLPADIRSVQRVVNDLILSYGATDMLTVRNHFSSAGYRIDEIRFANGTVWGQTQINDRTLTTGTSGTDSITGYNGSANRMSGLSGNDYLYGGDAADLIDGGADNDSLSGRAGNDTLLGGDGNDTLNGEGDNDSLDGGTGLDILNGGDGNDSLDAGTGNDTLNGGNGSDSYILRQGSGYDVISQSDSSAGRIDAVHFENVLPADIRSVQRVVNDLILSYGATDMLTVRNHFSSAGYRIDEIRFANGTVWGQTQINDRTLTTGTSGTDSITGYNGSANRMSGLSGNDYLYGGDAADLIDGGADNDSLSGRAGNDTLLGGDGNDTLNGGEGEDRLIGGIGKDTYTLTEATAATDTLRITAGDSLISSFDVVNGFKLGSGAIVTTGVDKLDLDYAIIGGNVTAADGIDSGIIRSHSIANGKISFDDIDGYTTSLVLTATNLTDVYGYLQNNITIAGGTVAFTVSGSTYVFQDDGISDTLVQLTGVTATSIGTTGMAAGGVWIS